MSGTISGSPDVYIFSSRLFCPNPVFDDSEVPTGEVYTDTGEVLVANYKTIDHSMSEESFYTDQWGTWLSAYAPLYHSDGSSQHNSSRQQNGANRNKSASIGLTIQDQEPILKLTCHYECHAIACKSTASSDKTRTIRF